MLSEQYKLLDFYFFHLFLLLSPFATSPERKPLQISPSESRSRTTTLRTYTAKEIRESTSAVPTTPMHVVAVVSIVMLPCFVLDVASAAQHVCSPTPVIAVVHHAPLVTSEARTVAAAALSHLVVKVQMAPIGGLDRPPKSQSPSSSCIVVEHKVKLYSSTR